MRIASPDAAVAPPDSVYLIVSVTDGGPGLSADEQKLLFQRFAQAKPKLDSLSGFGLGLFVSRKIVELHDGFIEVDSAHGKGSTFSFVVPCQRSKDTPVSPVKLALAAPSPRRLPSFKAAAQPESGSAASLRVLIVEDNAINARVLKRQLELKGFSTSIAVNGLKALEALQAVDVETATSEASEFDCVLMDIEMPVMDGLTAVRRLREVEKALSRPHLATAAITGNARAGQIDTCLEAGFDRVFVKPYSITEVVEHIHGVVASD